MKKRMVSLLITIIAILTAGPAVSRQKAEDYYDQARSNPLMFKRIALYSQALEIDQDFVQAQRDRGILLFYQRKFAQAIEDFDACIEKGLVDAQVYFYRGFCNLMLERFEGASSDFSRALDIHPDWPEALSQRAVAHHKAGRIEEALQDVDQTLQLRGEPRTLARAYNVRGQILMERGQKDLARENFRKAADLDPSLALFRPWTNYMSPEQMSKLGMLALIVLPLLLIFNVSLPAPKKRD